MTEKILSQNYPQKNYFGILGFQEIEHPTDLKKIEEIPKEKLETKIKTGYKRLLENLTFNRIREVPGIPECTTPNAAEKYLSGLKKELEEAYKTICEETKRKNYIEKSKEFGEFKHSKIMDIKVYLENKY